MEHETHDTSSEAAGAQRPEKKLIAPTLGRVVEQAGERGAKQELVGQSLRRKLVSKFESPKPMKKVEATVVETKPLAKTAELEEKPVAAAPKQEQSFVEIPLSDAREPAEAFIDLRREQVAEELHKAEPKSVAQAEAAADATLLGSASQQIEAQVATASFTQAIDTAHTQTLEALQYPPSPTPEQAPVTYEADAPLSSFVQSYLEKREQTVRAIAHEQFDKQEEAPEFTQAMQLADLLAYSERVFIDGTSLRSMYETKQITESGLRRITAEYLRGGDVRKALGQEHLLNETKFERDPQMRDQLQASYANIDAAEPQSSQQALAHLETAGANPVPSEHKPAKSKSQESKHERKEAERMFARAWIALIVVLVIIAGLLILR